MRSPTPAKFELFIFGLLTALVVLLFVRCSSTSSVAPVQSPPAVAAVVPRAAPDVRTVAPTVSVVATAPIPSVAAPKHKHGARRSSCSPECAAYAKAYANARRANALLGVQRYREHA